MSNCEARLETISACWVGIVSLLTHCDTAERLKPHLRATFDGPPKAIRSSFISFIDPPCQCFSIHYKFTKCNKSLQRYRVIKSHYPWGYMRSNSGKAHRKKERAKAFLRSFVNGRWDWTLYFTSAVLEKNNLYNCLKSFLVKWLRLEQKWERQLIYGE